MFMLYANNKGADQCARGKSSIARKPEDHPKKRNQDKI